MYKLGAETAARDATKSPKPGKRALDQQQTAKRLFEDATQTRSDISRTSETTESHTSENRTGKDTGSETMGDATDGDTAGHAGSKVRKQPVRAAAATWASRHWPHIRGVRQLGQLRVGRSGRTRHD